MPARVLVVGLDGATLDLIEPWAARGDLPHLARLMAGGAWGRLRSTVPAATFPAWTSLVTGVGPGQHGIYDFTRRVPGTYRLEFVNATYRRRPSAWHLLSEAGRRVAAIGFPASYPPEPVNGVLISGFDSPLATSIDRSFVYPRGLYDEMRLAVGAYELTGFQELRIGPGWHDTALERLRHAARRRAEIAAYLLDREAWDCLAVHFGESDTVAHHFWAFFDPASPRYDEAGAERWGDAIGRVYQALDRAVGTVVGHAGPDATVLIVSDHGSGGTGEWVIHLNRWLEQQGWLRFAAQRPLRPLRAARRLGLAVPAQVQERVLRGPLRSLAARLESGSRLGGLVWAGTQAFSEEANTCPGIWLNVRGREPAGCVDPGAEYEGLRASIIERLLKWRHPQTGLPLMARVWRREELYHGPAVEDAPDIVLEPALDRGYASTILPGGQAGEPLRRLSGAERLGAKGGSMNGSHRPEGVLIVAGPGTQRGVRLEQAHIVDVAPTLLHLLGAELPGHMDGRVLNEALYPAAETRALGPRARGRTIVDAGGRPENRGPEPVQSSQVPEASSEEDGWLGGTPYSTREAAAVEKTLRGLGYRP